MWCNYQRRFVVAVVVGFVLLQQAGCREESGPAAVSKPVLTEPIKPVVPASRSMTPVRRQRPAEAKPSSEVKEGGPEIRFEKVVYDFGGIGPGAKNVCEFNFTNGGDALLKITRVKACCGFQAKLKGNKREYAPGENGTVIVTFSAKGFRGSLTRSQDVYSNDRARPQVKLTVKARIVLQVEHEPKRLNLVLKGENAGCGEITLHSIDNQPFAIKNFTSTANCITADVDSSVKKTRFVLQPRVDMAKLRRSLNGVINISLTHPKCDKVTIAFYTLPRFKITPTSIIVINPEPEKPIERKLWILNNYKEDFEIESASSKKDIIKVLSREKVSNGYEFKLQITPPASEGKPGFFTDDFFVSIKGGEKLKIGCRGFYSSVSRRNKGRLDSRRKAAGPSRTN